MNDTADQNALLVVIVLVLAAILLFGAVVGTIGEFAEWWRRR